MSSLVLRVGQLLRGCSDRLLALVFQFFPALVNAFLNLYAKMKWFHAQTGVYCVVNWTKVERLPDAEAESRASMVHRRCASEPEAVMTEQGMPVQGVSLKSIRSEKFLWQTH